MRGVKGKYNEQYQRAILEAEKKNKKDEREKG